jgi:Fe2+ transport system protein B
MNTKILMTISALTMLAVGVLCSFLPNEILQYIGVSETSFLPLIIQILGAIYFGFGFLNWTAKANLIGGIYSRPVAIGNLIHYVVSSLALIKFFAAHTDMKILLVPVIIYSILAILFGKVVFGSPV